MSRLKYDRYLSDHAGGCIYTGLVCPTTMIKKPSYDCMLRQIGLQSHACGVHLPPISYFSTEKPSYANRPGRENRNTVFVAPTLGNYAEAGELTCED
jgi:hypothetical protein